MNSLYHELALEANWKPLWGLRNVMDEEVIFIVDDFEYVEKYDNKESRS